MPQRCGGGNGIRGLWHLMEEGGEGRREERGGGRREEL